MAKAQLVGEEGNEGGSGEMSGDCDLTLGEEGNLGERHSRWIPEDLAQAKAKGLSLATHRGYDTADPCF